MASAPPDSRQAAADLIEKYHKDLLNFEERFRNYESSIPAGYSKPKLSGVSALLARTPLYFSDDVEKWEEYQFLFGRFHSKLEHAYEALRDHFTERNLEDWIFQCCSRQGTPTTRRDAFKKRLDNIKERLSVIKGKLESVG